MTPFKDKRKKKTESSHEGRGFKFDVIEQSPVALKEDMPRFFLADTMKEAENIYSQFAALLNVLAKNYAGATGLPASDLFGEGLIGLGRAYRDWDPTRSESYRTYAAFRIKDAIVEYIRDHAAVVRVPTNLKKARLVLDKLKALAERHSVTLTQVFDNDIKPFSIDLHERRRMGELYGTLIEYSGEKDGLCFLKFIEKLENLPEEVDYSDQTPPEVHIRNQQMMEAALVVDKLKEYMTPEELIICEGFMADKSFEEIGKELGKSKAWVSDKFKSFKETVRDRLK